MYVRLSTLLSGAGAKRTLTPPSQFDCGGEGGSIEYFLLVVCVSTRVDLYLPLSVCLASVSLRRCTDLNMARATKQPNLTPL